MPCRHITKLTGPGTYIPPDHKSSRSAPPALSLVRTPPACTNRIQMMPPDRVQYIDRKLSHRQFDLQPFRFSSGIFHF